MNLIVRPLTHFSDVQEAALITVWKSVSKPIEASVAYFKRYFESEHSPIRCFIIRTKWHDMPRRVAMHLVRHVHSLPFVSSTRPDRFKDKEHSDVVDCIIDYNAQALIDMARKRLCRMAWKETSNAIALLKKALLEYRNNDDLVEQFAMQALGYYMVPNCIYRGGCPEGEKGCGLYQQYANRDLSVRYAEYNKDWSLYDRD